jgi:hypothetical protein
LSIVAWGIASKEAFVMQYFYVEPEVAGGFGPHTVLDPTVHPPAVEKLHYEFDGWLGDAIVESFPCFIITTVAANAIMAVGMTGLRTDDVEVSASDEFQDNYGNRALPPFVWLKVDGVAGVDDFGIAADRRLVVSENALRVLSQHGIQHARIEGFA